MANQEPLFTTEETLAIDPLILAYLAGFFDGEGSIGIHRVLRKYGTVGFHLRCTVSQTSVPVLEKYRHSFGGGISQTGPRILRGNEVMCWQWYIYAARAARFLRAIEPYLFCKAPQVPIALRFSEQYRLLAGRGGHRSSRVAVQLAESCRAELMALHQGRGRVWTPNNQRVAPVRPVPLLDSLPNDVEMTYES